MVSTKRAARSGRRSWSCATRSEVGSVAFEESVAKAMTKASCVSRKKATGDFFANVLRMIGKITNIWRPSASRTTPTTRQSNKFAVRSEEHTSELQSLMRISYAVFCLKKKTSKYQTETQKHQTKKNISRVIRHTQLRCKLYNR